MRQYIFLTLSLAFVGFVGPWLGYLAVQWVAGRRAGLVVAVCLGACSLVGVLWGWRHVVVRRVEVRSASLPSAFDGYRIVQISDLHLGTFRFAPTTLRDVVDSVNALRPDLVVFTGDLVNVSPDEIAPFLAELGRIEACDGVLSVMGNHDYLPYTHYASQTERAQDVARVQEAERALGWDLLLGEQRTIERGGESISVVGTEYNAPLPNDLAKRGGFIVVLAHNPQQWRKDILPQSSAQLTLSGHTHAMQWRLGRLSPSRLLFREWGGVYTDAHSTLNVCTGTGSNIPFRLGAWPEVVLITLGREH